MSINVEGNNCNIFNITLLLLFLRHSIRKYFVAGVIQCYKYLAISLAYVLFILIIFPSSFTILNFESVLLCGFLH